MTYQELFAQAKEKLIAAKTLLQADTPDMEQIGALQSDAKALKERAEAMKAVAGELEAIATPDRPADLPTGGEEPPDPATKSNGKDEAVKAILALRFGETGEGIKAVLAELHGPDYEGKRYRQTVAFNRYLRGGREVLTRDQTDLLGEVILTPEYAIEAIKSGQDLAGIKTVMVEARNELGGYTAPVDWQASVIQRLKGLVVMRGKATGMQTSRDSAEYPTATGGDAQYTSAIRETMVPETPSSSAADTNLTWGQEKIPIHTAMAVARLSRNWLEDSAVNVAGFLAEKFAEAGAINEDNQFLTGDGNGRAQGLLPSSANDLSLTEAVTTNADYMKWDGLINLVYAPNSQYRGRCIFIAEKNTYRDIAKLKDSNGQYLWRDRFGNNVSEGGGPTRLMTYETYEQEAMPTVTAGAFVMLFGDPTGYLIADRIGMTVERYLDSSTAEINQVTFIMRRRFGGQCVESWKWAVQKVAAS